MENADTCDRLAWIDKNRQAILKIMKKKEEEGKRSLGKLRSELLEKHDWMREEKAKKRKFEKEISQFNRNLAVANRCGEIVIMLIWGILGMIITLVVGFGIVLVLLPVLILKNISPDTVFLTLATLGFIGGLVVCLIDRWDHD